MPPDDGFDTGVSGGAQVFLDTERTSCDPSRYLPPDAAIEFDIQNSLAGVTIRADVMQIDSAGRVVRAEFVMVPTSDRVINKFTFPMAEGFLQTVIIRGPGSAAIGRTFVQAKVQLGLPATPISVQYLCQGYVNNLANLSWPNGHLRQTNEGRGFMRSITGTTPAAGAEISETVPSTAIWRLISFAYSLTNSAAVANRQPGFIIDDGTNNLIPYPAINNAAAGVTVSLLAVAGSPLSYGANYPMIWPVPQNLWLPAGFRIRTNTTNLQAGDQYTAPQYLVEEFMFT